VPEHLPTPGVRETQGRSKEAARVSQVSDARVLVSGPDPFREEAAMTKTARHYAKYVLATLSSAMFSNVVT
jgi:hypothetical protein